MHPELGNFDAFMAYPLNEGFNDVHGSFYESPEFKQCEDEEKVREFTEKFPYFKPLKLSCQWLHKERLGRISEVRKNSYKVRFCGEDLPAKLKGSFYESDAENLPLEKCCRFSDCKHETEPGCAIKAAIESGELSMERYILFKNLGAENTRNYAKKKEISKWRYVHKQFDKRNIY